MSSTAPSTAIPAQGARAYRHQPPSLYVVPSFYDWLVETSADLAAPAVREPGTVEAAREAEIARLLTLEARLLDQGALAQETLS